MSLMSWMVHRAWPNLWRCCTFKLGCMSRYAEQQNVKYSMYFILRCNKIGKSCIVFAAYNCIRASLLNSCSSQFLCFFPCTFWFNSFSTNHKVQFHSDFVLCIFHVS
jgi:hypothetical protein